MAEFQRAHRVVAFVSYRTLVERTGYSAFARKAEFGRNTPLQRLLVAKAGELEEAEIHDILARNIDGSQL